MIPTDTSSPNSRNLTAAQVASDEPGGRLDKKRAGDRAESMSGGRLDKKRAGDKAENMSDARLLKNVIFYY